MIGSTVYKNYKFGMTEIKTEPTDILLSKLEKIRCCTGCLNSINYLVFGHGLYCSSCISTIPDINEDHFIILDQLAKVLVDLTQQYEQRIKGEASQLSLIKGQMQTMRKDVKKTKDGLSYDLKTVKEKSFALLDELFAQCLKENQNQPLQAFYQPDITATLILNESQLLIQNLHNLKIEKNPDGKISYSLKQNVKNPQKINKKVVKQYSQLNDCIESSIAQAQKVMANFAKDIAQEEKK